MAGFGVFMLIKDKKRNGIKYPPFSGYTDPFADLNIHDGFW